MNIGRAIRLARVYSGFSQSELAEKIESSSSHISLIERNKRDPSFSMLIKISDALGIPPALILLLAGPNNETHMPAKSEISKDLLAILSSIRKISDEKQ